MIVKKSAPQETASAVPVRSYYINNNAAGSQEIGLPGEFPYTRGIHREMYRSQLWTMRQYAGFATAAESNARYRYLLEHGQTGLSVAFDLPTQIGYDSDSEYAVGEVGKVGVAIDTLADMEILFDQIDLSKISTSMTINATASILLAMYIAVAKKRGIDSHQLRGTIQNDILKEYIARGTYIFPPGPSLKIVTDIFAFCQEHTPLWNPISVSGYHMREAGSTAGQEVGLTLADGIAYLQAAEKAGLKVDAVAPRISFFFNAYTDVFEEAAKFRAARRLWAKITKNRFHAQNPKSMMCRFHTQTAGSALTAQQPDNNVVRVTLQGLAAVLGGTQSLHTNSKDEALSLPTEDSARLALRTQQILAHESGACVTVDPLAGSYYVEELTDTIEKQAQEIIDTIDAKGGMVAAIEEGYPQSLIQSAAYHFQRNVEKGSRVIVGVNAYGTSGEEAFPPLLEVDEAVEKQQVAWLQKVRSERDQNAVSRSLQDLTAAAKSQQNIMPFILKCVEQYATIGEISQELRHVFGEYRENIVL